MSSKCQGDGGASYTVFRRDRTRMVAALVAMSALTFAPLSAGATVLSQVTAGGYNFINFDPTLGGGAVGSNANGISNTGQVVGTAVDANNASTGANYAGTPTSLTSLNTGAGQTAFGINSAGNVVGGNGTTAFFLPSGGSLQPLSVPSGATNAFGINDGGNIVGQFTSGAAAPGFVLASAVSNSFITVNAPVGSVSNAVNAQGINNNGLIVGFYLGNDGQTHGFQANVANAVSNILTGTAIADPTIPVVPGEPGATFVFSQILGVNDTGIAVGYYGDSTTSQHGFLYNTTTGAYTFLDDPSLGFNAGVEVTQITGINNSGEISGFYTDASGVAHSFVGCPVGTVCPGFGTSVPEPGALSLFSVGLATLGLCYPCGRKRSPA